MNLATHPLPTTEVRMARRKNRKPRPPRVAKAARQRNEPQDWQERHSPTVPFEVRGDVRIGADGRPRREVIGQARMRADQARLMGALDTLQVKAAEEIQRAAESIAADVKIKPQTYERSSRTTGGSRESERLALMKEAYFGWARSCQHYAISHAAISDVIVDGLSLAKTDATRRKRKGWAKAQVMAGLDLWAYERGWRRTLSPLLSLFVEGRAKVRTAYEAQRNADAISIDALSDQSDADAA